MKLLCVRTSASIELKDEENSRTGEKMNVLSGVFLLLSFSTEFWVLVFSYTFSYAFAQLRAYKETKGKEPQGQTMHRIKIKRQKILSFLPHSK